MKKIRTLICHCFMSSRLCLISALQKSWNNCQHLRKGRHYLALYPCHVCTLAWPPIVVQGKKVALWCAKWFTDLEDINKLFIQDSGQEVPSSFKRRLWKNNSPRSISLLSFYFLSLHELSGTNGTISCFFSVLCDVCHHDSCKGSFGIWSKYFSTRTFYILIPKCK